MLQDSYNTLLDFLSAQRILTLTGGFPLQNVFQSLDESVFYPEI